MSRTFFDFLFFLFEILFFSNSMCFLWFSRQCDFSTHYTLTTAALISLYHVPFLAEADLSSRLTIIYTYSRPSFLKLDCTPWANKWPRDF